MDNQQNQSQQPQPSLQPEIPKKPGLPAWAIIMIVVGAIVVLAGASYGVYWYFASQPEPDELPTAGEEKPVDEFANWQTYRSEEFGFEFKYPKDLVVRNFSPMHVGKYPLALGLGYESMLYASYADQAPFINLFIKSERINLDDLVNKIDYPVIKGEKIIVSEVEAAKLYNGPDLVMNVTIPHPQKDFAYIFVPSSTIDKDLLIFNQILSAFKFIEADETADWQTYRNEEHRYEFKYPKSHTPYSGVGQSTTDPTESMLIPATLISDKVSVAIDEKLAICCEAQTLSVSIIHEEIGARDWFDVNYYKYAEKVEIKSVKNTVFIDKPAVEMIGPGNLSTPYKLLVMQKDEYLVLIVQSVQDDFLDQILSTFKFIESQSTVDYKTYQGDFFEVSYSSAIWIEDNCQYQLCSVEFGEECHLIAGLWRNRPWNPVNITTWEIGEYSPQVKEWANSSGEINEIEVIFDIEDIGTRSFHLFISSLDLYEKCQDNLKELLSTIRFIK